MQWMCAGIHKRLFRRSFTKQLPGQHTKHVQFKRMVSLALYSQKGVCGDALLIHLNDYGWGTMICLNLVKQLICVRVSVTRYLSLLALSRLHWKWMQCLCVADDSQPTDDFFSLEVSCTWNGIHFPMLTAVACLQEPSEHKPDSAVDGPAGVLWRADNVRNGLMLLESCMGFLQECFSHLLTSYLVAQSSSDLFARVGWCHVQTVMTCKVQWCLASNSPVSISDLSLFIFFAISETWITMSCPPWSRFQLQNFQNCMYFGGGAVVGMP